MPLAPAYDWVDVILGFDTLRAATEFANAARRAGWACAEEPLRHRRAGGA